MKTYLPAVLSLIVLISAITSVHAQRNADQLLKSVVDKTNAYESLEADFTYTMVNDLANINEANEGKVFVKGDAYKLEIAGQVVISDGETVWTYLEESRELMISHADDGEDAITPASLLTSYYNDYKASFVNVRDDMEKGLKTIELKPVSDKNLSRMHLAVDEKNLHIAHFSVFDNNGNTFIYTINNLKNDVKLTSDFFSFNPEQYPDLEDIIDMR